MRLLFVDFIKGLAIFLVVYGHCIQYFLEGSCFSHPVWGCIYSFHMPLFVMVSGYFSIGLLEKNSKEVFIKLIKSYISPMLVWTFILYFARIILLPYPLSIQNIFSFDGLWFLRDISIMLFIFYFSNRICNGNVLLSFITAILFIMLFPWDFLGMASSSNYVIFLLPFLYLGCLLRLKPEIGNILNIYFLLIVAVFLMWFWTGEYSVYYLPLPNFPRLYECGISKIMVLLIAFRYIIGAVVCLFIWKCAEKFINFDYFHSKYYRAFIQTVSDLGRYTLGVYVIQTVIIQTLFSIYINLSNTLLNNIIVLISAVLFTLFFHILLKVLRAKKNLRWIFGLR